MGADPNSYTMSPIASHRFTRLLYLVLLLLASGSAWAQRVSIQTRLDRPEIRIGEQAAVEMVIRTDDLPNTRFHLVEDSTGVERFRILAFGAVDTVDLGGGLKEIQAKMIITSFDSTLITLPPILVETPSGQALSKPLALNVVSPQVDVNQPDKFEPIMAPWAPRLDLGDLIELLSRVSFFFPLALVLVALGLVYRKWKKKQAERPAPSLPIRQKSPLELFAERLAKLNDLPLATQEDFKVYYTKLIEELRGFFATIYHEATSEKTSAELLDTLRAQGMDRQTLSEVYAILQLADRVKFARDLPSRSDAIAQRDQALALAQREYTRLERPVAPDAEQGKEVAR